jgi:alpha-galactosidase
MPKITFIGAGSFGFTRTLVRASLDLPSVGAIQITLMDIHADRLKWSRRCRAAHRRRRPLPRYRRHYPRPGRSVARGRLCDRHHPGGATEVWRHDIEIPHAMAST